MIRAVRRRFLRPRVVAILIYALHASSRQASAQVDPLLYLKAQTPNIMLVVDTTSRMQRDADGDYYDPQPYTKTGAAWEATIGVSAATTNAQYYRKFVDLSPPLSLLGVPLDGLLYKAQRIDTVGDRQAGYATFLERTRIEIARRGLLEAIDGSLYTARFNLLRLGQVSSATSFETRGTVYVADGAQRPPAAVEIPGTSLLGIPLTAPGWKITRNTNLASAASPVSSLLGPLLPSDAIGGNTLIRNQIAAATGTTGVLLPLGPGDLSQVFYPVGTLLQATLTLVGDLLRNLLGLPQRCQTSAVVMIVGGGEPLLSLNTILLLVGQLLTVLTGFRVPVHVIAIAPLASDDMTVLRGIASLSGGRYTEIAKDRIDATVPGQPVAEVVQAINWAVQHALLPADTFNNTSTAALPSLSVEHQSTSPITGTVNLENRVDLDGDPLPATRIVDAGGKVIPQQSNVMVTAGYTLPGFDGKLRAFRVYAPVADASVDNGYRFDQDGTPLWVAAAPAAASRNIYTVLPDGTMTAFTAANAAALAPYLGPVNAADLIERVRKQPLGAIVGSTPAIMDPPSPAAEPVCRRSSDADCFFTDNAARRAIVFVGANDGMLHAIDGRTGLELWAFIPFNLLPKLRTLPWGHGLDAGFRFMVDSSPKLADVKVDGRWRTYLTFGEGAGGTFYNTIDVTLDGMAATVPPTTDSDNALLSYFATATRMPWVWSFPRLSSFDAAIGPYGDLKASASAEEKSVGQAWSDPAVAQVGSADGEYAVFVGSGYLPYSTQQQANRGGLVAGTRFYVLSAATGAVLASRDVGSDGLGETDDSCRAAGNCMRSKNALQMDASLTGPAGQHYVDRAYIGDLDGRFWRLAIGRSDAGAVSIAEPVRLFDAGAAEPLYGSLAALSAAPDKTYLFLGTGSDLLPSTGVSQRYRLLALLDDGSATAAKKGEVLLEMTDGSGGDEKVTGFPSVTGDPRQSAGIVAFYTTNTYRPAMPCAPVDATVYALNLSGGGAYDTNGDGTPDAKIFTQANARATAPFVVDGHLAVGVGSRVELFGDSRNAFNRRQSLPSQDSIRLLSWQEVR